MVKNKKMIKEFEKKVKEYTEMDVYGLTIHCPYWMNKIKNGKVVIRGFLNGKGDAISLGEELIQVIGRESQIDQRKLTTLSIRKLARRNRIGIDCSGFVYRILDAFVHFGYMNVSYTSLDQIFSGGITKTSARRLTSKEFSIPVEKVSDIQSGDMIRLKGGKHVALVVKKTPQTITYAHSSHLMTKIKGVHVAKITITSGDKPIQFQHWLEKTSRSENFGKKFFYQEKGDGVFRLKIFINS